MKNGAVRLTYLAPTGAVCDAPEVGADCDDHRRLEVAYAFGRRFGTAVERNRARRRLRHAFVEVVEGATHELTGGAFLLSGSRRLLDMPYSGVKSDVSRCLAQVTNPGPDTPTTVAGGSRRP